MKKQTASSDFTDFFADNLSTTITNLIPSYDTFYLKPETIATLLLTDIHSGSVHLQKRNMSHNVLVSYQETAQEQITDYLSKAQQDPDTYQLKFIHDELSLLLSIFASSAYQHPGHKKESWQKTQYTVERFLHSNPAKVNYIDLIRQIHHHELENDHPFYPTFVQTRNQILFNTIKNRDDDPALEYKEDSFTPRFLNQRGIFHFDNISNAYLTHYVYSLPSYITNRRKTQRILSHAQSLPYFIKEAFEQTYDTETVENRFSQEIEVVATTKAE
jgi:hypothetical protein